MHLQTNPSIPSEGSMRAIGSGYRLKYGCLLKPDGQISAPRAPHQVLLPYLVVLFLAAFGWLLLIPGGFFMVLVHS